MKGTTRRVAAQGPLGFSAGLPRLLTAGTLTAWLAQADVSYAAIGAFALISLVYNAKILWAPLLDRFGLPVLDRRRGWILATQVGLAVAIAIMGTIDPGVSVGAIALAAVAVAFLGASQDIVIDAYRTDILENKELGRGTAGYVTGYRVGMIIAGSMALIVADHGSWQLAYWLLAGMMLCCTAATFWAPSLPSMRAPASLRDAVVEPFREFFSRRGALAALAFVMLFNFGDGVAAHWVKPFLLKKGLDFSLTDVAAIQQFLGIGATLLGAWIGGLCVDRWRLRTALLVFGAAQAIANIGYVALALIGKDYGLLVVAIGIDKLCTGLGTAAFVACLMALCHARFSATQYALLTSVMSLWAHLFNLGFGFVIESMGWPLFFAITMVVALPALLLIRWLPLPDQSQAD